MQQITSLFATFGFLLAAAFMKWELIPTWSFLAITPCLIYWAHLLEPTSNFLSAILAYAWHPRLPKCPWLAPFTIPLQSFIIALVALNALTVFLHHFNVWAKLFPHRVTFPRDPNALKYSNLLSYPFPTVSWSTVNLRTRVAKFPSRESRNFIVKEDGPLTSESSDSSSSSVEQLPQLTTPKNGKTYRPPCPKCQRWHKKNEVLCETPLPTSITNSALRGDDSIRAWLGEKCILHVDPKRVTVIRSFLQSAKAQVQLVHHMTDFGLIYPPNCSLHTKSTVIEHEYNTNADFAASMRAMYMTELAHYQGVPANQIPSPCTNFRNPNLSFK